jgi:molybdopterin-binding protein
MRYGARNQIIGEVESIKKGTVMSLVKLKIPRDSKMASVMTLESLKDLGLRKGDKVKVVVKAVNVLLVSEESHTPSDSIIRQRSRARY